LYVSVRIRLDEENVTRIKESPLACHDVPTVKCLLNGISMPTLKYICSPISFSPDYVSVRIGLDEDNIFIARTKGTCRTRYDISTV
jgi:hypothetical protein